jgi:hypothetical protein
MLRGLAPKAAVLTILLGESLLATPQALPASQEPAVERPASTLAFGESAWQNSSLIKTSTVNEWCRHCPDWNQTSYSFKLDDGTVYVGQTHKKLDVMVNGHTKLRFEKDGHVGEYMHIIDDGGQDKKLKVIQKIAPERADQPK